MTAAPQQDVGDALVRHLIEIGVEVCFGVPGGQTIPLYGATRRAGFKHVLMHDERNTACAADAYARVSGKLGVCDATVGPGATNLVSGIAEAFASAVPVLAIVGDAKTSREHLRQHSIASQAMQQRAMLEGVSKQFCRVHRAEGLADTLENAVRVAVTGRCGPVMLEIPEDVFFGAAAPDARVLACGGDSWPRYQSEPCSEDLSHAVALIAKAERPVILAGGGAIVSKECSEVVAFAEALGIPVVTSINGKGAIDEFHPLSRGAVGVFGSVVASRTLQQADVVIVFGSKFAQFNSFMWRLPAASQTIIQIDTDGAELGRAIPVSLAICADAGRTAKRLRDAVSHLPRKPDYVLSGDAVAQPGTSIDDPHVAPEAVIESINAVADENLVLVADASLSSGWSASRFKVRGAGRKFLAPRGLAGIGWAGGAAIGAALALPAGGRVVAVSGDGAAAYWIGEIETAVRLRLPIIFVILNNSGFGWIMQGEAMLGIDPKSTFAPVDFAAIGRATGAAGHRCTTIEQVDAALTQALGVLGPTIIDVISSEMASPSVDFAVLDPAAASAFGAYGMG